MNEFDKRIARAAGDRLRSVEIDTIQVNLGLRCNHRCVHCHLDASPQRDECMDWPTMELVLQAAGKVGCQLVDLTGGAPELNPHFRPFVQALTDRCRQVQTRTNLTVLAEPGMENLPKFLRDHRVQLVASLPCYLEENVDAQRGAGVYEKSIRIIRQLNALGYGIDPGLQLNLVHNPAGPFLPPDQTTLEADYRRQLHERFAVSFSRLLTIANMPIGRFQTTLRRTNQQRQYARLLEDAFNPDTIDALMCRHQISVGWDGTLYDCDFNLALGSPVDHGAPDHIIRFDPAVLKKRRIVTGEHCFGCTAGSGSSCGGALA
ncbi:MAG TPA: arsenosugar biosynthesis radical SAM (seleno)protein ArsS [Phycisphaerae bacterium]|nr:arsenosugar biosynthesis radical SAM (seleno)protein ArsS [Phycisphaerae bacterium]